MENNVEFRRSLKQSTPSVFVSQVHTEDCRMIPSRTALLHVLPRNGVVAEIGAAFGDFTREIMHYNSPSRLHLIDMWESERYKAGLSTILQENAQAVESGSLVVNRGMSTERLVDFDDDYFDWVYIDTDHSYITTFEELKLSAQKVKDSGFIAGHDFCPGNVVTPWPYGVVEACNKFCVDFGWKYRYLTVEPDGHQSFALSKI